MADLLDDPLNLLNRSHWEVRGEAFQLMSAAERAVKLTASKANLLPKPFSESSPRFGHETGDRLRRVRRDLREMEVVFPCHPREMKSFGDRMVGTMTHSREGGADSGFADGGSVVPHTLRPKWRAAASNEPPSFSQRFQQMAEPALLKVVDGVIGTAAAAPIHAHQDEKERSPSAKQEGLEMPPLSCLTKILITPGCSKIFNAHLFECTYRDPCPPVPNPVCDSWALLKECKRIDSKGHMNRETRAFYIKHFKPYGYPAPDLGSSAEQNVKERLLRKIKDDVVDYLHHGMGEDSLLKKNALECVLPALNTLAGLPQEGTSSCEGDFKKICEHTATLFDDVRDPKMKTFLRWILTPDHPKNLG